MKKLLSILLAACMLLTMLSLPAVAVEAQAESVTIEGHTFDFAVDQYGGYANKRNSTAAGTGLRNYSSVVAGLKGSTDGPTSGEAVKVDYVEYGGKTVMRIRYNSLTGSSDRRTAIIPHYKDASGNYLPVRLKEGKSYSISYNLVPVRVISNTSNNRIFTELWPNTAATGFRDTGAGNTGYGKWSSAAMYDGHKLTPGSIAASHGNYVPVTGLYVPINHKGNTSTNQMGYDIDFSGFNVTRQTVYSITDDVATEKTADYGIGGTKNFPVNIPQVDMLPLNDPDEDTDGDFDDLGDWNITWDPNAAGTGAGAYKYNLYGGSTYHYTDALAISLPVGGSNNVYFEVAPEDVDDLPFPDQVKTIGDKTYALVYNEIYLTDFTYSEVGKCAINYIDGDNVKTVVYDGAVIDPEIPTAEGKYFLGWYYDEALTQPVTGAVEVAGTLDLYAKWTTYVDNVLITGGGINTTSNINTIAYTDANGKYKSNVASSAEKGVFVRDNALVVKNIVGDASKGYYDTTNVQPDGTHVMTDTNGGTYRDYTMVDANGNPLIAESNTEYIVNITYKQVGKGKIGLRFGAGRKIAAAERTTNDHQTMQNISGTNTLNSGNRGAYYIYWGTDFKANPNGNTGATFNYIDENVKSYQFTFKTGDLSNTIPEFNMVYRSYGLTYEHCSTEDGFGLLDDGVTYRCKAHNAEVEIYSIQIVKVGAGDKIVEYKGRNVEDADYTYHYDAGVPGTDVTFIPDNYEQKWYTTGNTLAVFNGKYPSQKTTVYDYQAVLDSDVKVANRSFVGTRGFFMSKASDGTAALLYKPYTYDEYYEKYGLTIDGSNPLAEGTTLDSIPDETKLSVIKRMYETPLWNMYRLPDVELVDGDTYKVTVKYKADSIAPNTKVKFTISINNSAVVNYRNDLTEVIDIAEVTNGEWVEKTIYFTADLPKKVTTPVDGQDDTMEVLGANLYVYLNHDVVDHTFDNDAQRPVIYFDKFEVENIGEAIAVGGASSLTDEAATAANQQAMRVYFSYATEDGNTIKIGDDTFNIVARGFVYKNGALDQYTATINAIDNAYKGDMRKANTLIASEKTSNFNECWDYVDGRLVFSNYIRNFSAEMYDYKVLARAYVTFEVGDQQFTVYSKTINRSINGIEALNGNDIEQF